MCDAHRWEYVNYKLHKTMCCLVCVCARVVKNRWHQT